MASTGSQSANGQACHPSHLPHRQARAARLQPSRLRPESQALHARSQAGQVATPSGEACRPHRHAPAHGVSVTQRADLAMVAVQGPQAREAVLSLLPEGDRARVAALGRFAAAEAGDLFIARTGYTGEDGFEVIVPAARVVDYWNALLGAGVKPCGLGARDTLRLEAGMNLYGQDMDEQTSPLEANLAWTIAFEPADRDFIGRAALEAERAAGVARALVGLVMDEKGVLRHGQVVHTAAGTGEILSGTFSPTLGKAIAFARVPAAAADAAQVDIRGKLVPVRIVKPVFVRDGKAV